MAVRLSVHENTITPDRLAELGITLESIREQMQGAHRYWCAVEDTRILGFATGDTDSGTIFALFVRPEHEGRGIGTQLMAATVETLHAAGHQRLTLTTDPGSRAYAFYHRQGWREVGRTDQGQARLEHTKQFRP